MGLAILALAHPTLYPFTKSTGICLAEAPRCVAVYHTPKYFAACNSSGLGQLLHQLIDAFLYLTFVLNNENASWRVKQPLDLISVFAHLAGDQCTGFRWTLQRECCSSLPPEKRNAIRKDVVVLSAPVFWRFCLASSLRSPAFVFATDRRRGLSPAAGITFLALENSFMSSTRMNFERTLNGTLTDTSRPFAMRTLTLILGFVFVWYRSAHGDLLFLDKICFLFLRDEGIFL